MIKNTILPILFGCIMVPLPLLSQEVQSDTDSETAIGLAEEADLAVDYDPVEQTFDLGITKYDAKAGFRRAVRFDLEDLGKYFDSQRRKNHVVVILEKRGLPPSELEKTLEILKNYFLERGYQRITVQRYFAFGRETCLDHKQQPDVVDRPATVSESKAKGGGKPES